MSEGYAEIIRSGVDAFNRGDWDAAFEYFAPDFELDNSRDLGEWRGVHRSADEVKRMWATFTAPWESWRMQIDEIIEAGEHLVTRQTMFIRGRDGIELTARNNFLWTIRDGAVTKLVSYPEVGDALEAAGLSR